MAGASSSRLDEWSQTAIATHKVTRPLEYRPVPLSHGARQALYELLDEWYSANTAMPRGGFTDLCEIFQVHPLELSRVLYTWRRDKRRTHSTQHPPAATLRHVYGTSLEAWQHIKPSRCFHGDKS